MLALQERLAFSDYLGFHDLIIPQGDLFRRINSLIDLFSVYGELVSKYCPNNGRTVESPVRMFKYLLLEAIYDLSGVDAVERSRYDMSFKYFLGMVSGEDVIEASSLYKFRELCLKDTNLLDSFINKTVAPVVEKGIIKPTSAIADATHIGSRPNPHSPVRILKLRSKQLRKCLYEVDEKTKEALSEKNSGDVLEHKLTYTQTLTDTLKEQEAFICIPKVGEKLNLLKETSGDIRGHYTISKDEGARIGYKSKESSLFRYKTHIGTIQERIITAAVIASGEKGDSSQLPALIEQSWKSGTDVQTVIDDSAYSGKDNLEKARDEHFELVAKSSPSISQSFGKEESEFDHNKDVGMSVCPADYIAIRRAKQGRRNGTQNQAYTYYLNVHKCQCCLKREGRYKPGARSETYSVPIKTDKQQQQIEFQQVERFKEKAAERYRIEAKNAELGQVYGYDRVQPYGLLCMKMQGVMTIFAANPKKILKFS